MDGVQTLDKDHYGNPESPWSVFFWKIRKTHRLHAMEIKFPNKHAEILIAEKADRHSAGHWYMKITYNHTKKGLTKVLLYSGKENT